MNNFCFLHNNTRKPIALACFVGLVTLLLSALFLRKGIVLSSDGWGYWEGAVSLLAGNGYTYFGGEPIIGFGPLFSLYLAGVQLVVGIHGWALSAGVTLVAALASSAWVYLFVRLAKPEARWLNSVIFALYSAAFISFCYRSLLSETLFLLLLALLFLQLLPFYQQDQRHKPRFLPLVTLNLCLLLLLACRNSTLTFVPGIVMALFYSRRAAPLRHRLLPAVLTGLLAVGGWLGLRAMLGQTASHPVELGGHFTPLQYGQQLVDGLASLLGPDALGLRWWALGAVVVAVGLIASTLLIQKKQIETSEQRVLLYLLGTILSSAAGLYLLFNLTNITDPLTGRFLWFLVLGILGFLAAWATWMPANQTKHVVLTVVVVIAAAQLVRTSRTLANELQSASPPVDMVTLCETIRPDYWSGPPIVTDSYTLIAPPTYHWIDRHYREQQGTTQRPDALLPRWSLAEQTLGPLRAAPQRPLMVGEQVEPDTRSLVASRRPGSVRTSVVRYPPVPIALNYPDVADVLAALPTRLWLMPLRYALLPGRADQQTLATEVTQ